MPPHVILVTTLAFPSRSSYTCALKVMKAHTYARMLWHEFITLGECSIIAGPALVVFRLRSTQRPAEGLDFVGLPEVLNY